MILVRDARERKRFIKFTVVGAFGFVVDFLTFNLCRSVIGLPPAVASVISFMTAVTSNFVWNRYWTYPESRSKPIAGQLAQFFAVNIVGLLIRTAIFVAIKGPYVAAFEKLAWSLLTPQILGENLALATVVVIVMLWNFFINHYWTYADVDNQPAAPA